MSGDQADHDRYCQEQEPEAMTDTEFAMTVPGLPEAARLRLNQTANVCYAGCPFGPPDRCVEPILIAAAMKLVLNKWGGVDMNFSVDGDHEGIFEHEDIPEGHVGPIYSIYFAGQFMPDGSQTEGEWMAPTLLRVLCNSLLEKSA